MDKKNIKYPDQSIFLRNMRGSLTQQRFADELNVPLRTYHRYEKGERKIPNGLMKLVRILQGGPIFNKVSNEVDQGGVPGRESGAEFIKSAVKNASDPFFQSVARLKTIFDNSDARVQSAILTNMEAFNLTCDILFQYQALSDQVKENTRIIEIFKQHLSDHKPPKDERREAWIEMKKVVGLE